MDAGAELVSEERVVELSDFRKKREELVFECSDCTSQLFYLNHDGTIECRGCKRIMESIEWRYRPGQEPG